jgi:ATP-dependent Zn protease
MTQEQLAALHESAHAVAQELLLSGVECCSIEPTEERGGTMQAKPYAGKQERVIDNVLMLYAGPVAEMMLGGAEDSVRAAALDRERIEVLLQPFIEEDRLWFRHEGMRQAMVFVHDHADAIRRLADLLIENKTLDGECVRQVLEGELP